MSLSPCLLPPIPSRYIKLYCIMSGRMRKHILEAQIAESTDTDSGALPPIAATLTLEACKCKHLQKFLPHVLDLTCAIIPESGEDHWIMANPVHALHMASQLEPDGATVVLPNQQSHGEPALYGDEQLRTKAITTIGISPTVELINQEEEDVKEYATRNIVPTHLPPPPSFATMSAGMMSTSPTTKDWCKRNILFCNFCSGFFQEYSFDATAAATTTSSTTYECSVSSAPTCIT